ncbi:hypothetical protein CONLIGDRAFT_681848 [Coniochaeta ligniaria NRRL 30616]|uniref:R3H domain-containing protein n=1 Tax=Coniochaeta ligniaria NRRL 30616 TaxID=1408157 RepID=A0A1J7IMV4_9PEZI|nr:hypothetical protein CONLIGDRAFT_681848 [Coniochaeta ligniaria NRRL 30616]
MAAVAPDAAASAAKDAPSVAALARAPQPNSPQHRRDHVVAPATAGAVARDSRPSAPTAADSPVHNSQQAAMADGITERKTVEGLRDLKIETNTPNLVVNGTGSAVTEVTERSSKNGNSQTPSDENSLRADSSSELGTKPPSLDGKSITSGTTFALDEKESLRPDDSASVKAAAEDDDAFSIRGSLIAPGSRMGSEVAVRTHQHQIQLGDMPPTMMTTRMPLNVNNQDVSTPPSSGSDKQPVTEAKLPLVAGAATPDGGLGGNMFYRQNPDEKLLEAIQSPKDRLFLLRLEEQVINFVQDSKEPFMDLPPCNSFCRMLTHKLADYYHMTHSFEAVAGAVRIYRTPFCRVPPPLSAIIVNASSSSSPAPAVLPRKIMRRGQDGEFGPGSGGPSKTTSEAGSDGKDKTGTVDKKLTREEREEKYNKARERIFGSIEKIESNTPENDDGNGVSRASSVSAKEKAAQGKKKTSKQRRDDSESFDSRSQYVAYAGPQQPTWGPAQYMPVNNPPFNAPYQPQQQYPNALQPIYNTNQSYPQQMVPNNGFVPGYHSVPNSYPAQPVPQPTPPPPRYQPQSQPVAYPPPMAMGPQQGWQQPNLNNHSPYQARATPATGPVNPISGIPYAYGQLPVNIDPSDPKSQHPIPGSYNRNGFNPKTQSFVPGNGMAPMPTPPVPYGGPSPHHGSPQFNSPHMGYASFQQPMPPQPAFPSNGTSYGMVRQSSNSSLPPYHHGPPPQAPLQQHTHSLPHGPIHHGLPPNPISHNIPNKPAMSQGGPGHGYSTLPHYGNPATLPQKPT